MTLKDKLFDAVFDNSYQYKKENIVSECEVVADEFAIGFAEWFRLNCYESEVGYYTASELLETYKKEKGL